MKISAFFRPKAVSALTEAILRASKSKSFLSDLSSIRSLQLMLNANMPWARPQP